MKFIQLVLRRPMSIITLILGVVVFGSASLTGMPLEYHLAGGRCGQRRPAADPANGGRV